MTRSLRLLQDSVRQRSIKNAVVIAAPIFNRPSYVRFGIGSYRNIFKKAVLLPLVSVTVNGAAFREAALFSLGGSLNIDSSIPRIAPEKPIYGIISSF